MAEQDRAPTLDAHERARIVAQRIEAVRRLASGQAGLLLERRRDFAWLTLGGQNHVLLATEAGAAPLLITPTRAVVLAPVNEAARIADEEVADLPLEVEPLPWWQPDAAREAARRICGDGEIGGPDDLGSELDDLRMQLAPIEHERMAWLGRMVGRAMAEHVGGAQAGQTEDEVGAAVAVPIAAAGARLPVLLAAADERIERYRHPLPGADPVRRRLMVVVVAERWGVHVAQTTFRELEPLDDETAGRAVGLESVLAALREATIVGATLGDVLDAARRAYAAADLTEEWELHHQGGTIGYAARERIAVPGDRTPIRPGMAFAWNPSARGYKLEETFFLDEAGKRHVVAPTIS
jgi:Xaa-Pro aminopeptidase